MRAKCFSAAAARRCGVSPRTRGDPARAFFTAVTAAAADVDEVDDDGVDDSGAGDVLLGGAGDAWSGLRMFLC